MQMDLFLNTLFIKKYISFSVHFQPIFFFNTSKRGWEPPSPGQNQENLLGRPPGPKRKTVTKKLKQRKLATLGGKGGSFSWILFPLVNIKIKLTPHPKPIPHSQGQKAALARLDSSPLGASGPGQLEPPALTRRGCFSWQSGLGKSLPGPPEAWEHPPPPSKGNAVSAGLRAAPPT